MKMDLSIRRADQGDIEMMTQLLKVLFSIEEDFIFNEEKQRRGLESMLKDQENRCVFIAEYNGQIVGMVSGQALLSTAEGGISVVVENLIVKEVYRKRSIGKELLFKIEKWADLKKAKRLQLLAENDNFPALNFIGI
ncbi:GNAT family N-acetyltransferase [Clostridium kluyveri]|uniref:N-acetyltransferase domain-containing protein n=2 Tax=Clostridium kluyveri TaxID=1534 RepID=A5N920_CLOK5|nr:GNAT family N-acetyltransferase [Clostridium kluyveri]EDK33801.1 Conserved hypothetical protein [Clostridium kluyveri DSM 555]BAH06683.1 hypothetical protein CKR_1632 [Clostridium kluyveri NBRC 12016]